MCEVPSYAREYKLTSQIPKLCELWLAPELDIALNEYRTTLVVQLIVVRGLSVHGQDVEVDRARLSLV